MDRSGHRTIQPQDQAKSKLNGPENLALSSSLVFPSEMIEALHLLSHKPVQSKRMAKYQGLSGGYHSGGEFMKGLESNRPVILRIFSFWSSRFSFRRLPPILLYQLAAVLASARQTGLDQIPPVERKRYMWTTSRTIRNSG
jgi:hypothetical protein